MGVCAGILGGDVARVRIEERPGKEVDCLMVLCDHSEGQGACRPASKHLYMAHNITAEALIDAVKIAHQHKKEHGVRVLIWHTALLSLGLEEKLDPEKVDIYQVDPATLFS